MAVDMTDRLRELRGGNSPVQKLEQSNEDVIAFAAELEECFSQVDKISRATGHVEDLCSNKLPVVHNSIMTSVGDQKAVAMERHTELTNQVKNFYKTAINGLKRLEIEIKTAEGGPERFSAEFRIRKSQYSTLSRNLKSAMMKYNSIETNHKEEMKNLVIRKLKTTGTTEELTDEKLEELVESKASIFTQDILIDIASKKKDLEEIDERKKQILKLEENVLELNEMFFDMMLLVEEQGDLIDNIENNVEKAAVYVSKGKDNTIIANKYNKKNTRLKWVICIVISVVAGVLLIVIGIIIAAVVGIQGNR